MHPHALSGRYPLLQVVDPRQPFERRRPQAIALPMHPAGFHIAVADLSPRPRTSLLAAVRRLAAIVGGWRRRARMRRELLALDDRMLRDIGVTRVEALHEFAKPFWR